jgi:hypothetical protein
MYSTMLYHAIFRVGVTMIIPGGGTDELRPPQGRHLPRRLGRSRKSAESSDETGSDTGPDEITGTSTSLRLIGVQGASKDPIRSSSI